MQVVLVVIQDYENIKKGWELKMLDNIFNNIKDTKDLYEYKKKKIDSLNKRKKEVESKIKEKTNSLRIELYNINMELKILE